MNIERPGSPSATTVAPTSKRRSASIETKRSRLASERPPKKGVASKNAFRSGELTAIDLNILPLPAAASGPSPTGRIYDKYLRGAGLQIEQADWPDHWIDRFGECFLAPFSTIGDPLEFRARHERRLDRASERLFPPGMSRLGEQG